jgi:hypothetical protein
MCSAQNDHFRFVAALGGLALHRRKPRRSGHLRKELAQMGVFHFDLCQIRHLDVSAGSAALLLEKFTRHGNRELEKRKRKSSLPSTLYHSDYYS